MTNNELADLLEEAARRLRRVGELPTRSRRLSADEFGAKIQRSAYTVRRMCRDGILVARRIGGDWSIDADASEKALSLKYGNAPEKVKKV